MRVIGAPRRPEIDNYAIKFLVGAIALGRPFVELALTRGSITSISASFWIPDPNVWPRTIFVGCLFAISEFLLAYNGRSETEMWLGKVACLSKFGVAVFPCGCADGAHEIIGGGSPDAAEWVQLNSQQPGQPQPYELARWLTKAGLEELLRDVLDQTHLKLETLQPLDEAARAKAVV